MSEYATISHTRASERTKSRHTQEQPTAGEKQAIRDDKSIRAWSSGSASARQTKKMLP